MQPIDVLLLSRDDVLALDLSPSQVVAAVTRALAEHAAGSYEMRPKIGVHPTGTDPANFIHAMPGYLHELDACGLKWVGGFAKNGQRDLPNVTGVQIINDTATGVPLAIMDCGYLTGLRTAAVSAIAARECAREGAEVLAMVGCGFEGTKHVRFLTELVPSLRTVRLYDIRPEAVARLADEVATYFDGEIVRCQGVAECLHGADVISTCTDGSEQVVAPQLFKAGAFAVGIEGGCAFTAEALQSADKFVVDDVELAEYFDRIGQDRVTEDGEPDPEFPGGMPEVYATIGEIVTGRRTGRQGADERIVATPIGMAICDVALARLAYETALERGIGTRFRMA
ncbi:MAG TPA: ornithine cyclodeaminase family protein [Actinomycetota bacterium]|nr:ornithine cyclodeaminase family protein [Actinomycetota bacterium]